MFFALTTKKVHQVRQSERQRKLKNKITSRPLNLWEANLPTFLNAIVTPFSRS